MSKATRTLLCLAALLSANVTLAQGNLDAQRESWVIMARQGQLDQAIEGLSRLYAQTGDRAVLDDLIALMVRDERYRQALDLCAECSVEDYSSPAWKPWAERHDWLGSMSVHRRSTRP